MTLSAVIATYLTVWFLATLAAVSWHARRGGTHAAKGGEAGASASRPPFLPIVMATTFVAAFVTALVVFIVFQQTGALPVPPVQPQ
ncbi:DUF1467 family protein [Xanthobacter sp. TB0136]|uniref:DUF1467 family protein n=1 Tax=Xanthobacter sp. TB0136 TaxID=3459177 RepID=UPI00403989D6